MYSYKHPIILASGSRARNEMLQNVGLEFQKIPADIDEGTILKSMHEEGASPENIAVKLADEKALHISKQNPDALVIGSDQVLEQDAEIFQKASDLAEARAKLEKLKGKTHQLISSVSVVQNGEVLWRECDTASLTMHDFDDAFLDEYLQSAGEDILACVGAYAFEKHGAWLFKEIDANYFTILGMPLLPLLAYLAKA